MRIKNNGGYDQRFKNKGGGGSSIQLWRILMTIGIMFGASKIFFIIFPTADDWMWVIPAAVVWIAIPTSWSHGKAYADGNAAASKSLREKEELFKNINEEKN